MFDDFIFFRFFQAPMSNLQKNHVKIDVFNEPKYRFDPNQVHSSSFQPHKTPKKQKKHRFRDNQFLVEMPPAPLVLIVLIS